MLDLFSDTPPWQEPLAPGAVVLRRFARERAPALLQAIADVASQSPFRQMVTPGGYTMSVAMTNCGALGWTTDRHGYLYAPVDPVTDQTWPPMPAVFHDCPGAKLSLHQDKDEQDLRAPIVSVSLGLPAIFQFGGLQRSDPLQRLLLEHGDVVVWGGESRLFYHGIQPLKAGHHPETDDCRYNLTFRQAGGRQY